MLLITNEHGVNDSDSKLPRSKRHNCQNTAATRANVDVIDDRKEGPVMKAVCECFSVSDIDHVREKHTLSGKRYVKASDLLTME